MQKIGLQQKQQGKFSPKQVQFVQMLQVPAEDMIARIQEEIEENPTLETEESQESVAEHIVEDPLPSEGQRARRYNTHASVSEAMLKSGLGTAKPSLHEQLLAQLSLLALNTQEKIIAQHLIGSLAADGYLRTSLEAIMHNLSFRHYIEVSVPDIKEVLTKIQNLEPAGIAARNLRECLLLQLKRQPTNGTVEVATDILTHCFEDFSKKNYRKIALTLHITSQEKLKKALSLITHLAPKPVLPIQGEARPQKRPDFIVKKNEQGTLEVALYYDYTPNLRVRKQYRDMLSRYERKKNPKAKEVAHFVKEKIARAQWFIESIHRRKETLLRTMKAIVKLQRPFFETQDEQNLRPLFMRHIAEEIGMDLSTVSRVVSKKSVLTDFGTFPLKYFFSEAIATTEGKEISSRTIKATLQDMIANENKEQPYTDEELVAEMKTKGFLLARRTIAKYRTQLGLPIARMRRELL